MNLNFIWQRKYNKFLQKLILIFIMCGLFSSVLLPAYSSTKIQPTINTPQGVINNVRPIISGTAEPGTIINIYMDDVLIGYVMCNLFGNWLYAPNFDFEKSKHTLSVYSTDALGNKSDVVKMSFDMKTTKSFDTDVKKPLNTENGLQIKALEIIPNNNFFAPSGKPLSIKFNMTKQAIVKMLVYHNGVVIKKVAYREGEIPKGDYLITWNGTNSKEQIVASGEYYCKLYATDDTGYTAVSAPIRVTVDSEQPKLEVFPDDGTKHVPATTAIKMFFSEAVLHADEEVNFSLRQNGNLVKGVNFYDNNTKILTFIPSVPLLENVTYGAYVGSGITDCYGNFLPAKSWSFTTGDFRPPVITYLQPESNTFKKGSISVSAFATDNVGVDSVLFEYSADSGATWKTIEDVRKQSSGNKKDGLWNTTCNTKSLGIEGEIIIRATASDSVNRVALSHKITVDNSIPEILGADISKKNYSPDSNNNLKMQTISYTVNEDALVTVQILSATSALVTTLASDQPTKADKQVNLAWNGHLDNNSESEFLEDGIYTALIQVVDNGGNVGLPVALSFQYDRTKPQPVTFQPVKGNVSVNSWPRIVFDENLDPATINSQSFTLRNLVSGNIFPASVYYDVPSRTAYMQSNLPMESNTLYEVTMSNDPEDGIKDFAGNSLSKELKWQFSSEQNYSSPFIFNYNPGYYVGEAQIKIRVKDDKKVKLVNFDYSTDDLNWDKIPGIAKLSEGNAQDGWWLNTWDTSVYQGVYLVRVTAIDEIGNLSTYKYSVDIIKSDKAVIEDPGVQQKIDLMNKKISINIPAQTFEDVEVIQATEKMPEDLPAIPSTKTFVGEGVDFTALDANGNIVNKFANPVNVTLSYDLTGKEFLDEASLHIFYHNPKTGTWEKLITKLDKINKTVSAELPHFSLYAVLADGKKVYLPTQKYKVTNGKLTPTFIADDIAHSPYEPYLPNEKEPWNYRIHSNYSKKTDACPACHSAHTAVGGSLLQWYSIYDTCMACHDGTVTTTYDVVEGKIGASGMPTFGGAFGSGDEVSLSRHNVSGGTRVAMAPGGSVVAVTYEALGDEVISWQLDFTCVSCHEPHGQGGNARILNPDPNGAARRNWIGGQFISDDRIGQTRDVTDWNIVSENISGENGTIIYAVYPKRNSPGGLIRDTQQNPLTWLTGYLYTDPDTNYTKIKDSVYQDGIPENKYTIDNSNGYTYLVFTNTGNGGENDYLPKDKNSIKINFVASMRVTMEVYDYMQYSEQIKLGTGINNFCGSCHTSFNTATTANFVYDGGVKENFTYHATTMTTQHQLGMNWDQDETVSNTVGSVVYTVYKMRFEEDPWGVKEKQIVTCLTCHFAHGTSQDYWSRLYGKTSVLGAAYIYDDADLIEDSGVSYLKRLPNDDLCIECHPGASGENYKPKVVDTTKYTQANANYVGLLNITKETCGNISCHPQQYEGWKKTQHYKDKADDDIVTCEDCHGPASVHAQVYSELNIVSPANISKPKQTDICGQCHIRGINILNSVADDTYGFRPGQDASLLSVIYPYSYDGSPYVLADNKSYDSIANATYMSVSNYSYIKGNEYTDFIQSKHYTSLAISCNTCHNPHGVNDIGLPLNTDGLSICATCHDTIGGEVADWKEYVDAHMPIVNDNGIKFRTHSFR